MFLFNMFPFVSLLTTLSRDNGVNPQPITRATFQTFAIFAHYLSKVRYANGEGGSWVQSFAEKKRCFTMRRWQLSVHLSCTGAIFEET